MSAETENKKKPRKPCAAAGGVMGRLSPFARAVVAARAKADDYGEDVEAWVADMITTAIRSPQGYVLRFAKASRAAASGPAVEVVAGDLFGPVLPGEDGE